jgi:hypothetical protein
MIMYVLPSSNHLANCDYFIKLIWYLSTLTTPSFSNLIVSNTTLRTGQAHIIISDL